MAEPRTEGARAGGQGGTASRKGTGRKGTGADGEAVAARYLAGLGYAIRERNYRCPHGELDLIATEGEYLVFVEVKTRSEGQPLHPALSVTARKRARVRRCGEYYWAQHPALALQPRFDVISVFVENGEERIEHIPNAF